MRLLIGISLVASGLFFASVGHRPWIDYDFLLAWYGILLLLDFLSRRLGHESIFASVRKFLIVDSVRDMFWWFYEWINLYTGNWAYSLENLYSQREFGVIATVGFATVLPFLVLVTMITSSILFRD